MKKIALIPAHLLAADAAKRLKLQEQPYFFLIPKHLLEDLGITSEKILFDLILDDDNRLLLVGTEVNPRATKPTRSSKRLVN